VTGFGFSLAGVADFDAWLDEFGQHLDRFVALLGEHTIDAMARARDQTARQRLVSLQGSLAGMRPWLRDFFERALGCDRFTTPALVRGIYFASVMQTGLVHNPFVEIVATSPPATTRRRQAQGQRSRLLRPAAVSAGDLPRSRSGRR
jgi:type VI secretion system protein ImpL